MKKILFLLLITVASYGQTLQNPTYGTVKLKQNITSTDATKVNVQQNDGTVNTKPLSDFGTVKSVTGTDGITVANGTTAPVIGISSISQLKVAGLVTDLAARELIANKVSTITASATNYPNNNAVIAYVASNAPVTPDATTTVKGIVKLAGDLGGTADLPTVPALATKANLASPTFTGTPTAPTATAGTNTTQLATTAFVLANGANNAVLLTGNQIINGTKTFISDNGGTNTGKISIFSSLANDAALKIEAQTSFADGLRITNIANASKGILITNNLGSNGRPIVVNNTTGSGDPFVYQKNGTDKVIINDLGTINATSFIKNAAPTTNILLAGGTDIPQSTFQTALTNPVTGTGTTNFLPKFTGSSTLGNSTISNTSLVTNILHSGNASSFIVSNGSLASNNVLYLGNDSSTNSSFIGSFLGDDSFFSNLVLQKFGGNVMVGSSIDNGSKLQVAGAATFASSVTATQGIFKSTTGDQLRIAFNDTFYWKIEREATNGNLIFSDAVNGQRIKLESITGAATFASSVTASDYRIATLNTAPASATATGTLGEIRYDANYIYLCTATNTWKRSLLSTW
jgi:hypothetical protein